MLIPLEPVYDGELQEWAMIELQGEIVRNEGDPNAGGYDVGVFSKSPSGALVLTIGYHQLEGAEQPLKKPFVVIEKSKEDEFTGVAMEGASDCPSAYKAIGIVRKKYLFKQRPRALITKPAS
eukprot:jgi/Picsp_1/4189/NSC_01698-R1_chromosome transmission fidelity protein 8 homolog